MIQSYAAVIVILAQVNIKHKLFSHNRLTTNSIGSNILIEFFNIQIKGNER